MARLTKLCRLASSDVQQYRAAIAARGRRHLATIILANAQSPSALLSLSVSVCLSPLLPFLPTFSIHSPASGLTFLYEIISRFTVPGAHAHWVGSTATPESWH